MTIRRRFPPPHPLAVLAAAAAASAALVLASPAPAAAADTAAARTAAASGAANGTAANASGWTLDRLMATLAQHKSGRATFVETKYLSIAARPIKSSGELVFVAPDHLEKHTIEPKAERMIVDGDKLTVERNDRRYTLALANYPELGAFIDSIRATLAGNRFALEDVYKVALSGRGENWTLTLTPRDARMLKVVSTITLDGTRDVLHGVAIRQADGDHSLMRLVPEEASR